MAARSQAEHHGASDGGGPASARIDVWLWSVRQVKSRSAATSACKAGHVRVNGETAKPAQHISVGDEVRYRVNGFDRLLTITRVLTKRVGAPIARTAYIDSSPPRPSPWTRLPPSSGIGVLDGPRRRRGGSSTLSWEAAVIRMTATDRGERPHH